MKKTILTVVVLLLFLNIRQLYTEIKHKNQLSQMSYRLFDKGEYGQVLSPTAYMSRNIIVDSLNKQSSRYSLFVVLTDKYCSSCITKEIENINEIYLKFPALLKVKYISTLNVPLEHLGAKFPYESVSESFSFTKEKTDLTPPFAVLLDSLNVIHSVYRTEFNNHKKSNIFYDRIIYLFNR